jgi:hypothetical protein
LPNKINTNNTTIDTLRQNTDSNEIKKLIERNITLKESINNNKKLIIALNNTNRSYYIDLVNLKINAINKDDKLKTELNKKLSENMQNRFDVINNIMKDLLKKLKIYSKK